MIEHMQSGAGGLPGRTKATDKFFIRHPKGLSRVLVERVGHRISLSAAMAPRICFRIKSLSDSKLSQ